MTGTTYSRTSGTAVLPGTWAAVRARKDIPDADKLDPSDRYDFDMANAAEKQRFVELALQALTTPPDFLRFALHRNNDHVVGYPGESTPGTFRPDGYVVGTSPSDVMAQMGLTNDELRFALGTFHGPVSMVKLPAGTAIYRTVGLTANPSGLHHGSVTNRLLGPFWEATPPSSYRDVAEWRAATAVLAEWNGDYGYIQVTLAKDVLVLGGAVAEQPIGRAGNGVLPGGGQQYFIPRMMDSDLTEPLTGRPLREVIQQTCFKGTS